MSARCLSGEVVYPARMTAPHYAEAFVPMPGRCLRFIQRPGEGGPIHCPEPPVWRGSWRAPDGRRYRVDACQRHRPTEKPGVRS